MSHVPVGSTAPLPAKLRRVLELAYGVEGVVAAKVWQWPGGVAIGVRGANATSPTDLLRRVELAVAGLREGGEAWDFGILEDGSPQSERPPLANDPTAVSSPRRSLRSPF